MEIYLAGIPAGWRDHVDWKTTESRFHAEMGCTHRLHSFHFQEQLKAYLEFRKERARKQVEDKA